MAFQHINVCSDSIHDEEIEHSTAPMITTYDKTIAAKHEYLGRNLEEIGGRIFLDEGSIVRIPILMELEVVLVPGQTLPLTAYHPPTISMLKEIIKENKTFGVMCFSSLAQYGTTAEIFEFQEENDSHNFIIKAKGRQRFKLLESKTETPGVFFREVLILPEISLENPLQSIRLLSLNRYRKNEKLKNKVTSFDAAQTTWPSCIFKQYDVEYLGKIITAELKAIFTDVSASDLPSDPVDLSYWVAQCMPIDGEYRVKLLSFNTAVERLQYAYMSLSKGQKLYCLNCGSTIAEKRHIFSMSVDGPQGLYCNPGGYVHDVVTVYCESGLSIRDKNPSVEYCWFPGYGWIIAECSNCHCHIGWQFVAMESGLQPAKFWGLSRRSITTRQKSLIGLLV